MHVITVVDEMIALDVATALQSAAPSTKKLKKILRAAEVECRFDESRELLALIRLKITHMEDQTDSE